MGCFLDKISADIVNNCDHLAVAGIESDVILIPYDVFSKAGTTVNVTNRMILDDLVLNSGEAGFVLEGVKQLNKFNTEFVPSEDSPDKWRHIFDGRIMSPSAVNRLQASKMTKGQSYLVVVHRKYKGVGNADAFLVLGWDSGLYVTAMTEGSEENDGAIVFTLSSKDKFLEYDMGRNLLIGDYAATLTAFGNKFLAP